MSKKEFIEDEELVEIANEVIEEFKLDNLNGVKIKYVLVSPNISKTVAGKCIKPNAELKYFGNFDYLIEFSNDLWEGLNEDVKKVLMYHELLHILVVTDEEGNTKYKIVDHNVKDFYCIIEKFGIDWLNKIRSTMSAIHDLSDNQQDRIKI